MKAYKGFNRYEDGTLWCSDFPYEVGKTYKFEGKPILCERGFHACHEPHQCWPFYPNNGENVYYEVECGGKIVESLERDGKFVCTEITLIREIPAPENKVDWCCFFSGDYAMVELNDKYNYIDTKGKYLSEQWFNDCWNFQDGYSMVKLNGKWNYIDTKGKLLSEQWFDDCYDFSGGYARVELNGKYNFIDAKGKLLSKQWFDDCYDFSGGYARVELNGKQYIIYQSGVLKECFV
jgi:hypothetical protein